MHVPSATYRLQLSADFTFEHLLQIVDYLNELGISTIYASPFFMARKGSTHGYDVTDPLQINSEIGTLETFYAIKKELANRSMSWLQDIVPNHMAFDNHNQWLNDVLENGPQSDYHEAFDVDWNYPKEKYRGKVMAPFLGAPLEEVLEKGEFILEHDENGFFFRYYDHHYPASARSYPSLLTLGAQFVEKRYGKDNKVYKGLKELIAGLENHGQNNLAAAKKKLSEIVQQDNAAKEAILHISDTVNGSQELMSSLLEQQYFYPAYWKTTEKEINYRRFFTINDLICLKMENEQTFNAYHQFIRQLCDEGAIQGLRIDHIDGLFDPKGYLERLRQFVGSGQYIIIEKILEWTEKMPLHWPVQGTSGYVFLAIVSHLFTQPDGEEAFTAGYEQVSPQLEDYETLIFEKKKFIIHERMAGELQNLCSLLEQQGLLPEKSTRRERWIEALGCFMASFPVYRIYPQDFPLKEQQKNIIVKAFQQARQYLPDHTAELEHLRDLFLGEAEKEANKMIYFLQRCQQFTGPLAAKGVEDTSFYIYNRLISHNEVGDSPHVFGLSAGQFHQKMLERHENFPLSINATATHDTKRGEDARMRINVLSEIPEEWFSHVEKWRKSNQKHKLSKDVPTPNEEYFIYQALIGALPQQHSGDFLQRTQDYIQKVLREAKVNTSWSEPQEDYEKDVLEFTRSILESAEFRESFDPLSRKTSFFGAIYSLCQCLIKTTAPGIPDIYQGTELWDLSYVDPDNRRPVDFLKRSNYQKEITSRADDGYIHELLENYTDGRVKMYTLVKALHERRANHRVFDEGEYLPLKVNGQHGSGIISYVRQADGVWYLIVVPRLLTGFCQEGRFPVGSEVWLDSAIDLPPEAPQQWANIYTGDTFHIKEKLPVALALSKFPVALLKGHKS